MIGASFRRQTPIGPYIVDFVCHAAKLIIELDGGQHFESSQEQRDARRDAFLVGRGFRVLRFNNHDVMSTGRAFWKQSLLPSEEGPLPDPPPQAGEGARRT